MAPIRRYLRITKYSVLECRVYLDNPALAQAWLLNPRDPVLPRVIDAVRPFVLPKLREERERSRKKSTKKRGIKDTVAQDDFEVSIFLTETSTRHSLLYKHKHFRDTTQTNLTSNSTKLTGGGDGASRDAPIDVDDNNNTDSHAQQEQEGGGATPIRIRREEDDDDNEVVPFHAIPSIDNAAGTESVGPPPVLRASKRRRDGNSARNPPAHGANVVAVDSEEDDDLFVATDDDESEHSAAATVDDDDDEEEAPPAKRRRKAAEEDQAPPPPPQEGGDDKKKLAMDIRYEGFSIYGRVLCLVVKRREANNKGKGKAVATTTASAAAAVAAARGPNNNRGGRQPSAPARQGQAVMENWITSTQLPAADG